jgi:hypothetical protein
VGSSAKIYAQIIELCVVKYRDATPSDGGPGGGGGGSASSGGGGGHARGGGGGGGLYVSHKETSYCTLRSQARCARGGAVRR